MGRCRSSNWGVVVEFSCGDQRRRLYFSPLRLSLAGGLLSLVALGAPGAGGRLIFGNDRVDAAASQEKQAQVVYEKRIAALRRRIEELAGRQFVDEDSIEGKMQFLARRQAQIETRAAAVAQLVERAVSGGVTAIARAAPGGTLSAARRTSPEASPAPIQPPASDPLELRLGGGAKPTPLPPTDPPPAASTGRTPSAAREPAVDPTAPLPRRLERLADALDRVAQDQRQRLSSVLRPALEEAARLRRVFDVAGVPVGRYLAKARQGREAAGAVGGPFIAAAASGVPGERFERDLAVAQSAIATLDGLRRALPATPVRAPLAGPLQPTSSFGYRTDPFLGRPALHSGIDLRDSYGAPVRAAAGGVVTAAGPQGGYGNLVEIDHGDGMATRYGHLAEISVAPGAAVRPGTVIGRVGSTGRSTGPHLHYEVRIAGEPVDPARFLEAASLLSEAK